MKSANALRSTRCSISRALVFNILNGNWPGNNKRHQLFQVKIILHESIQLSVSFGTTRHNSVKNTQKREINPIQRQRKVHKPYAICRIDLIHIQSVEISSKLWHRFSFVSESHWPKNLGKMKQQHQTKFWKYASMHYTECAHCAMAIFIWNSG